MIIESSNLSADDVVDAVQSALADELNIAVSNIDVFFDIETGIATYEVIGDDMESIIDAITTITDEDFVSKLDLVEELSIDSIQPPSDIMVTIDVAVDASNVSDSNIAAESVIESLLEQDDSFEISSQITFRTASPTLSPIVTPSMQPSSSIPSRVPSQPGWVSTVTATTTLTEPLEPIEIDNYASMVAESYGVDLEDVEVQASYTSIGSMLISIPDNIAEEDLTQTQSV
jgi:hypothetical protein